MSLERRSGSLGLESPIYRMPNGAGTNFGSPKKSEVIKTNKNSKLMKKFQDLEDPSFDRGGETTPQTQSYFMRASYNKDNLAHGMQSQNQRSIKRGK
jgi:hypothetical protein